MPQFNKNHLFFFFFLIANILFWQSAHLQKKSWDNVPAIPQFSASAITLGDREFAYRYYATMLQNLGNVGGQYQSLKDYDYKRLKQWFLLTDELNPVSDAVPMLATYYYGAVKDREKLNDVLDYLSVVGQRPEGQKWRWLGHAVFLVRHEMKDNKRALELAYLLSENQSPSLGDWAKQMPAFILAEEGQTELAFKIMLNILISNVDAMHPNEIFYMQDYICNTLLRNNKDIQKPKFCAEI